MAVDLRSIFAYWDSIGVFDVVLPFFLIFAVAYSIFTTSKILGGDNKVKAIVSIIIGVLFVQNQYLVSILQSFIPNVAMFIIVFLMIFLVAGMFLGRKRPATGAYAIAATIALIFVLLALGGLPGGYLPPWLYYYFDDQTIAVLLLVAVFVGIIWFVTKPAGATGWAAKAEEIIENLWGKRGGGAGGGGG